MGDAGLHVLRERIDELDARIVELLSERARVAVAIGASKIEGASGGPFVPAREARVFERVLSHNKGPMTERSMRAIYREIMSASIAMQQATTIAFLGPAGTHAHQAARARFGDSVDYTPSRSIGDVLAAVSNGAAMYGVVPFENSTVGIVAPALDALAAFEGRLAVRAETIMPVTHALLSRSSKMTAIRRIYSHPQGLAQCRAWLAEHAEGIEQIAAASTAAAAQIAAREPDSAAVASAECAQLYGLQVVANDIQDSGDNATRFLIVARESGAPTARDKTLLMLVANPAKPDGSPRAPFLVARELEIGADKRRLSALCGALGVFQRHGVVVAHIEARPLPHADWKYCYFVEAHGHQCEAPVASALSDLAKVCSSVRVIGSFPDERTPTT